MKIIKAVFLIALGAAIASYILYQQIGQKDTNHKIIRFSGNIEATEVRLAFRVSGKIKELLSDEGGVVKTGEIIARLDTDELVKVKDQSQAALKAEQFVYERAQEDYRRFENLLQAGAIAQQKRDEAKTRAQNAAANVEALRAGFDLALTRLGFAELVSPLDGFILTKSAQVGEIVTAGATIFTAADLKNAWLTAYVAESELGKVKLNQQVVIKTDSYPEKTYKGRISFISSQAEFTPKQIQTKEERVKLVYRIKVEINNDDLELKPGMPADGTILVE